MDTKLCVSVLLWRTSLSAPFLIQNSKGSSDDGKQASCASSDIEVISSPSVTSGLALSTTDTFDKCRELRDARRPVVREVGVQFPLKIIDRFEMCIDSCRLLAVSPAIQRTYSTIIIRYRWITSIKVLRRISMHHHGQLWSMKQQPNRTIIKMYAVLRICSYYSYCIVSLVSAPRREW